MKGGKAPPWPPFPTLPGNGGSRKRQFHRSNSNGHRQTPTPTPQRLRHAVPEAGGARLAAPHPWKQEGLGAQALGQCRPPQLTSS